MTETPKLKCSFCGKSQDQVEKLIAGPEVYICNNCVDLCIEILNAELNLPIEMEFTIRVARGKGIDYTFNSKPVFYVSSEIKAMQQKEKAND